MENSILEFVLIVFLVLAVYKYLSRNNKFFRVQGVKYVEPAILFGNLLDLFVGGKSSVEMFQRIYDKFRWERAFGFFMMMQPIYVIRDAELVQQITIKDFDHFTNRDSKLSRVADGLFEKSIFLLENGAWRDMRNVLAPMFRSSKLKTMFSGLLLCARDLTEHFNETRESTGRIKFQAKEVFSRYSAQAISTTTLGFKDDCIKNKYSIAYELALHIQKDLTSVWGAIKLHVLFLNFPSLVRAFDIKIFRQSTHDFFKKFVTDEIARRELEGSSNANDVIQLLIEAKSAQHTVDWSDSEMIAAQVFIFFAGGFETTSSLLQTCSWELARNQSIQRELIQEVDEVLTALNGSAITYEALNNMKFLEMIIFETLRKWPPLPGVLRECNRDFTFVQSDGSSVIIRKGDSVMIPFRAIQHDPKYFRNPSKFDPQRFSDENTQSIVGGSFLPFGLGPRVCIGSRLAVLEAKLAFFTILSNFTIHTCEQTPSELTYSQSPFSFRETIYVELRQRQK